MTLSKDCFVEASNEVFLQVISNFKSSTNGTTSLAFINVENIFGHRVLYVVETRYQGSQLLLMRSLILLHDL